MTFNLDGLESFFIKGVWTFKSYFSIVKLKPFFFFFFSSCSRNSSFPGGSVVKNLPAKQETQEIRVQSLGQEDPLEEEMATHSGILVLAGYSP